MSPSWPHSLLDASAWPHPVEQLQLVETHISWVILTGSFAYKIKKPVALGFLDFTSLEQRHFYCERELQLNRRFSDNLYLEVVSINGDPEHPTIGGSGPVIDYAVKMRQFDNRQLADHLAREHRLTPEHITQMADTLAEFHQRAAAGEESITQDSVVAFHRALEENFQQMGTYPLSADIATDLQQRRQWLNARFAHCRPLLESRLQQGYVKDCHGDCHLGNIAIIDNRVTLFDCIEFNDAFRIMDTFAEAAFLSMDLCARDLGGLSQRFLNGYLEIRGDYEGLALLDLYRCYYALVRAKVLLMKQPTDGGGEIRPQSCPDVCHYVALSQQFTQRRPPVLVLMHGLSGCGKSFLAEQIVARSSAIRIRSDVERKRLYGLKPQQSGQSVPELYSKAASTRTFERLLSLAQSITAAGFSCIVDATFLSASSRRPFLGWAQSQQVPLAILHCHASDATVRSRLSQREAQASDASDADIAIYEQQKQGAQPFTSDEASYVITVDTEAEGFVDRTFESLVQLGL